MDIPVHSQKNAAELLSTSKNILIVLSKHLAAHALGGSRLESLRVFAHRFREKMCDLYFTPGNLRKY